MKKSLGIIITLLILLGSCRGQKGETSQIEGLSFDSIVADTTVMLGNQQGAPGCHLHLSIMYAKGENSNRINDSIIRAGIFTPDYFALSQEHIDIKLAIDSFVKRYVHDYQQEFGPFYRQDAQHAECYNNTYRVRTHVEEGRNGNMVYIADTYFYSGGDHGIMQTIATNFDCKTGHIMQLSDVLVPGFEPTLTDIITNKMLEKFDVKSLDELNDKGIFEGIDVYPSSNFILGKKGITFIYVEFEVAAQSIGEIRIEIPYDELKNIMK